MPTVVGSMPLMMTFSPLLFAASTTSLIAYGVDATTPGIASICFLTSRHSVKSPSSRVTWMCAFEPRIFSRRSLSKPLITDSTQTSAPVPIHTPPIGTVVKNVKNARSVPKNSASPARTHADQHRDAGAAAARAPAARARCGRAGSGRAARGTSRDAAEHAEHHEEADRTRQRERRVREHASTSAPRSIDADGALGELQLACSTTGRARVVEVDA